MVGFPLSISFLANKRSSAKPHNKHFVSSQHTSICLQMPPRKNSLLPGQTSLFGQIRSFKKKDFPIWWWKKPRSYDADWAAIEKSHKGFMKNHRAVTESVYPLEKLRISEHFLQNHQEMVLNTEQRRGYQIYGCTI